MDSDTEEFRNRFRREMPVCQRYAYFDHAAVSPLPARSAHAMHRYVDQASNEGDACWPEWSAAIERTRQSAARMIGGDESEIALVPNTTFGITLVAEAIDWQPYDNVVVPENEFPSNILPWSNLDRRGVQIRLARIPRDGVLAVENLEPLVDDRTRMIALSWVGFSSGFRCDLKSIVQFAHSREILVFLDAIQGLGAFPLDVKQTPVDFLAADGHKWMLGPEGAGLLYIRNQHLEQLSPINVGWNSLAGRAFDPKSAELKSTAARYEGGSVSIPGMLGWGSSLEMLLEMGANQPGNLIEQSILENSDNLTEMLTSSGFLVDVPNTACNRSGTLGVRWLEADAIGEQAYVKARKGLLDAGVVTSVRQGKLRISTHAYNNTDDFHRLVTSLVECRRSHGKS